MQAKVQQKEEYNAKSKKEGTYYLNQIIKYRAKNRKTTDFPAYEVAK